MALLSVYRALLSVCRALLTLFTGFLQISFLFVSSIGLSQFMWVSFHMCFYVLGQLGQKSLTHMKRDLYRSLFICNLYRSLFTCNLYRSLFICL